MFSILNDKDSRLVNFYKVLKNEAQCMQLAAKLDETAYAKECFEEALGIFKDGAKYSEVDRAWALFVAFLQAALRNPGLNMFLFSPVSDCAVIFRNKVSAFRPKEIIKLLDKAQIYNGDALVLLKNAKDNCFIYVDPPYINTEQGHYLAYNDEDYEELLKKLSVTPAKFMLSSFTSDVLTFYTETYNWHTYSNRKRESLYSRIFKEKSRSTYNELSTKTKKPFLMRSPLPYHGGKTKMLQHILPFNPSS